MTDYEDMSLEELQALKEQKVKKSLVDSFKAEDETEALVKQEEHDASVIEDYLNKQPDPTPKITTTVETTKVTETNKYADYFKDFVGKEDWVSYENTATGKTFNFTDSDSSCPDVVTAWSPEDVYVGAVWHAMYCHNNLFEVCVQGLSIDKGDGLAVQIRTIGKLAAPTTAAACECISCVSASFSTYTLTLDHTGLMTEICEVDIWDVGEVLRTSYMEAMGKRWAEYFDTIIYGELTGAAAGTSVDLAATLVCTPSLTGSCCTDASLLNFYNAVNQVVYTMREGTTPYNPDYMIVSPSVAAILKRMQTPSPMPWAENILAIDTDGKLTRFNGLKVIEYCGANACSTATDSVFAVILDSSRAIGSAWGKRPTIESERNIDCDSTTYVMWCYWACDELDVNAIAHIKSPDA
jgi:hypothetical protein